MIPTMDRPIIQARTRDSITTWGKNGSEKRTKPYVRVRQPGVEWEHRHLDGKSQKECQEEPDRIMKWNLRSRFVQLGDAECIDACNGLVVEIKEQNAQQHQHRAKQR